MTTTRHDVLLLLAVTGTFALCLVEAATGHFWCSVVFGLLAVACAGMFLWQAGEDGPKERHLVHGVMMPTHGRHWHAAYRRVIFAAIREASRRGDWTWRVKP